MAEMEPIQSRSARAVFGRYVMMGHEFVPVPDVPAGCVCGIGGLQVHMQLLATGAEQPRAQQMRRRAWLGLGLAWGWA